MKSKLTKLFLCFAMLFTLLPMSSMQLFAKEVDLIINDSEVGTDLHQISFSKDWGVSEGYPDRFYGGDEHWYNFARYVAGSELPSYTVKFKGTGIEIYGEKQSGLGIYDIYLDGTKIDSVDAYSATKVASGKLYSKSGIPYGDHTLKVVLTNTKNTASKAPDGEMDYVKVLGVQQEGDVEYVTKVEDSSTTSSNELYKFKYNGSWSGTTGNSSFSNGDEHYAYDGDSVEMRFIGTKIEYYGSKNAAHGIYDVTIDGEPAGTADASTTGATKHKQLLFTSPVLTNGEHTIKFELKNQTGKAIQLDYVNVYHGEIQASSIALDETSIRLESGMTKKINASVSPSIATNKDVVWESADESIATVDDEGTITAVSETVAETTVTATIKDTDIKAEVAVKVIPAVEYLSAFVGDTDTLDMQEHYASLVNGYKETWSDVAWKGDVLLSKVVLCSRDKDVNNAEVIASDFVNGDATISSSNVDIKWLKDVKANIGRGSGGAPVKDFPEVIDKGGKIDIEPNKAKFSWLTINVPEDAEPGTYTGTITVNADELEEPYEFEYTFEVLDIVQPTTEETDTQIQVWQHPFSVAEYFGVDKEDYFTEEHFKYMRDSMKEYHSMGGRDVVANIVEEAWNHQSYYGDPSMVKWTKKADGTMEFNYDWYDAWIDFQIETGVLNPEEGIGQIKCYSIVPWANQIAYYDEASGTTKKQSYTPGTDAWKNMWTPFLQDFMKHSKEKGWFDITYISMDERGINELMPAVDLIKSIVDENGVPFKISSAFNYDSSEGYDFSDKIDDISIGMSEISHTTEKMRDMSEHRRELGLTTTVYTCTGMYPNNFTISDPADNEYVMWYTLTQNSDGFMRWAWDNYVPDMHGNITYKYWEPGDGWFMYPGVKGVDEPGKIYSTPRYEMMKKGLRDINKAKYLMAQSDELNTKVTDLVRSIERPSKGGNGYGSATYANQTERNKVFTETARMRNGIMDYTREFIDSTPVAGDKTILQEVYRICVDTVNTGFTSESWTAFKTALNTAKTVLDKEDASQTEIDAAVKELTFAYENLEEDTTLAKDILKSVIDKADGFVANNKLDNLAPNVKAMILNNLAEAKMVYDNANATNNKCLTAWINLANALQYMDFIADKADLKSLIDECDALDLTGYTGGVEEFKAALAEAKAVYADDGVLQDSINAAYSKLSKAKDALVKDIVNKDLLANIIHDITNTIGDGSKYKKDTAWETFQTALANANTVLVNENATAEDVNKATTDLTNAYLDIRLLPDEALLQQLVDFLAVIDRTDLTQYNAADVSKILNAKAKVMKLTADPANITVGAVESIQDEMASIIDIIQNNKVEPETPEVPEEPITPSPEDVAKPEDSAPSTTKPVVNGTVKPGTTKTGDRTNMLGAGFLLLASAGIITGLSKKRKH